MDKTMLTLEIKIRLERGLYENNPAKRRVI